MPIFSPARSNWLCRILKGKGYGKQHNNHSMEITPKHFTGQWPNWLPWDIHFIWRCVKEIKSWQRTYKWIRTVVWCFEYLTTSFPEERQPSSQWEEWLKHHRGLEPPTGRHSENMREDLKERIQEVVNLSFIVSKRTDETCISLKKTRDQQPTPRPKPKYMLICS